MKILISILVNGLLVYVASIITAGVYIDGYLTAILVGLVLGLVNITLKPVLTILTLPITILTLGLFLLVINGAMVLLVDWLMAGFEVSGWGWAIIFSLVLALLNLLVGSFD